MPPRAGAAVDRRFSIVIVHRGGATMLLDALDALAAAVSPERDEVIVVDNHSRDDSVERVRRAHPKVRVIANRWNLGFARACNQAIVQASGDYVLLLNNDALVSPDVLDRFERSFRTFPGLGVIGAQLFDSDGRPLTSERLVPTPWDVLAPRALRRTVPRRRLGSLFKVEAVTGACLAARAAAIHEVGLLDDEFFFYLEDLDWCRRMRAGGWTVAFDPDARVVHKVAASARQLPREAQIEMLRSRLILHRKVMHPAVAGALEIERFLRLVVDAFFQLLATGLTAGLATVPRHRLAKYARLASWMILGKPADWGLPDKPPHAHPPSARLTS